MYREFMQINANSIPKQPSKLKKWQISAEKKHLEKIQQYGHNCLLWYYHLTSTVHSCLQIFSKSKQLLCCCLQCLPQSSILNPQSWNGSLAMSTSILPQYYKGPLNHFLMQLILIVNLTTCVAFKFTSVAFNLTCVAFKFTSAAKRLKLAVNAPQLYRLPPSLWSIIHTVVKLNNSHCSQAGNVREMPKTFI